MAQMLRRRGISSSLGSDQSRRHDREPGVPMSSNTTDLHDRLKRLINAGAVRVVFQPIVDVHDGLIVAYEALSRPAPEFGFERPDQMFEAAAEVGLLWELECATRRSALAAATDWPRDVRLFLNNSPSVFADDRFADTLKRELAAVRGVDPDRVVLEITEMAQTSNDDRLVAQVARAKTEGFQVAVDDAGAGTSGLNRMMVIRPQWIKLDRTFCRGIDSDPLRQNLVRFFTHFARTSGVSVVAEGIESASELGTLIGLGVRYAQGYFLARPGDRASTMDSGFVAAVRERWATVEAAITHVPTALPLAQHCKPVATYQAGELTTSAAAKLLAASDDQQGIVLLAGRRPTGYVARARVLELGQSAPGQLLSMTASRVLHTLPPEATVQDALRSLVSRPDAELAEPLLVVSGSEVVGVIPVRELLMSAASDQVPASQSVAAITGLPARVRADQHINEMLARAADPVVRRSPVSHADVAFVDIRGFADFNSALGYDAGDRLIRELGDQLRINVAGPGESVFLSHLGDDRFMLTASSGALKPRLESVVELFERAARNAATGDQGVVARIGGLASSAAMGIRVLLILDGFQHSAHARDIYRAEELMRIKARGVEQGLPPSRSLMLIETLAGGVQRLTRSAG
jgi:EAL domain-containing protein (putative c-di-GMP-specific phosphodiesterase class I)/GGDEF domain-containing protein